MKEIRFRDMLIYFVKASITLATKSIKKRYQFKVSKPYIMLLPNKLIHLLISFQFITCATAQLTSSNLPIIVVTTEDEIPDEPKIEGSIGIIYDTTGGINSMAESFNYYSSNLAIETRGNSTQGLSLIHI